MTLEAQKNWVKTVAYIVGSFAPILFLGSMPATSEPARLMLDMLAWPIDGSATYQAADTRFLSAISAGFLLGWAVMIWLMAHWLFDLAPDKVRRLIVAGTVAWYVLDGLGSVLSGHAINLVPNTLLLLIITVPLVRPVKAAPD